MAYISLRFLIFLSAWIVLPTFSFATQKEKIIWFTWDLPPEFVNSGPWKD